MNLLRRGQAHVAETMRSLPLRVRLVATMLSLLVCALVLTSLATAYLTQRDLLSRIDAELRGVARPVAAQALQDLQAPPPARTPTNYAFVLMDRDGEAMWVVNPTGESMHPAVPRLPADDARVQDHTPFTVDSTDGALDWRFIAGTVGNGSATFAVGVPLRSVDRAVTRLVLTTALISALVLLLVGVIGWYAVNRAFRPLRRIEDTAAAIAGGDLTRRIPVGPAEDEVASLSRSLNVMLGRIESSFAVREASEARMRQFVGDASHELRTPLATVKGYAELYRQGAVGPADVAGAMSRIEAEAARMSLLVDDLLLLARLHRERTPARGEVDLTVVAADAVEDARVRSPERRIRVSGLHGPLSPTLVDGVEAQLRQVVTNLLANAVQHTPEDTAVEVRVGAQGTEAVVVVLDHGGGIPPAERPRVFERFYRADSSRGRSNGGSGLGLAIVAAIVEGHDGRVGIADTAGGGATFVVRLPLSRTDHRDAALDDPDDTDADTGDPTETDSDTGGRTETDSDAADTDATDTDARNGLDTSSRGPAQALDVPTGAAGPATSQTAPSGR